MAMFYDTRLLHFQDPRAPRFLLIDRKGRAALGIGGYVKATASYDFDGALPNRDFVTYDIPVPRNPAERNQYQMDASTTRLFLKLVGANSVLGKYTVYVESDFRGGQDYGFSSQTGLCECPWLFSRTDLEYLCGSRSSSSYNRL